MREKRAEPRTGTRRTHARTGGVAHAEYIHIKRKTGEHIARPRREVLFHGAVDGSTGLERFLTLLDWEAPRTVHGVAAPRPG